MSSGFRSILFILGLSAGPEPPVPPIYRQPGAVGTHILFVVADVNGNVLGEINPQINRVSWQLNGMGSMSFTMARTDPKFREAYFTPGNRVLLQFDNGLQDWGGVISGARDWSETSVSFEAFSAEWILTQRRTALDQSFSSVTSGAILSSLLQSANTFYHTGVRAGTIWQGGSVRSPDYHLKPLYEAIQDELQFFSTAAFDVTAQLAGGVLNFYLNFYERKGSDKPGIVLVEGRNVSGIRYRELDEVINIWHVTGDGDGWSSGSRLYKMVVDAASVAEHGPRENHVMRTDVTSQTTLDEVAEALLVRTASPTRLLGLTVLNELPGRFQDYSVGDAVTCRLYSYGFDGLNSLFDVHGIEFFPEDGLVDLVLEESR